MYFLYSLLTAAGAILLFPYWLVHGLRRGQSWRSLRQRLGYLPAGFPCGAAPGRSGRAQQAAPLHAEESSPSRAGPGRSPRTIWVHAVSVGEALAALPLCRRLKESYPDRLLLISTTTATGQRIARERMGLADGVFYFPLDWPQAVRRVLRAVNADLVVILETEIWPNFLREARRAGVPVAFVNGRISSRSFAGYRRVNGFFHGFAARVLRDPELFLMQSEADAERLRALGAPAERVIVAGNLKYDFAPPAAGAFVHWLEAELERVRRRPVLVAGSVVAEEERHVLEAFEIVRAKRPRALLVLAPRKPERFDAAARLAAESGRKVARRSELGPGALLEESAEVILLDTLGELAGAYRLADATFVGGSLVPSGGHNILEPAAFGKPPIFGPSMENFREVARRCLDARAGMQVASGEELGRAWLELASDEALRESMGRAARRLVENNRGATDRTFAHLAALLESRPRALSPSSRGGIGINSVEGQSAT